MSPLENPITWIPYGNNNNNDCSQGICNMYCPQWCNYIIYPPPPPHFEYPDDDSNPNFSPLVIAIIGILVTIFLLISYYTIISKYCGHRESLSPSHPSNPSVELQEENQNHVSNSSTGLDENLIKSIAVYKYNKKRDFFVGKGISDCSVCLSEFQDGESVRLLPKCNHGFHLPCIDTWLKSQSTCPLCRSSILTFNASNSMVQVPLQPQVIELELPSLENVGVGGENEFGEVQEGNIDDDSIVKASLRAYSDLSNLHRIRNEMYESIRSVSLDHSFQSGVSVAHHHVLNVNEVEDSSMEVGSSKRLRGESSKSSYKRRVLHCVMSPIAMKRSFSSGRFSFGKIDRGKQGIMLV